MTSSNPDQNPPPPAERALQESEAKFQTLVETASIAIVIVDEQGIIELVNSRTEEIFGYSREELVGQPLEILMPERFADAHRHHREGYFRDSRVRPMGVGMELAGQRKDGTEFPVEIGLSYFGTSEGTRAVAFITDLTLRKQLEESLERAIHAERTRLARELHDAVTQTLFSASLIAEVLPQLWQRKPEEAERRLEDLRQLTRGALAEMRALLYELRPAVLTQTNLGELLKQLGEATTGRARVPVQVSVEGVGELPPDVQVALYRIAQEALNNIAKHAGASAAEVTLLSTSQQGLPAVELRVWDDGRGFVPGAVAPQRLGLAIMEERASDIGAQLTVRSAPGKGTEIRVRWVERQVGSRSKQ